VKLGSFSPLSREELKEAQPWVEKLIRWLNAAFEKLYTALRPLANQETRSVDLTHDTEAVVKLQTVKGKPVGVQILASSLYDYATLKWRIVKESEIGVTVSWVSAPTDAVSVTLLVIGE
jgi:hypothetical protein